MVQDPQFTPVVFSDSTVTWNPLLLCLFSAGIKGRQEEGKHELILFHVPQQTQRESVGVAEVTTNLHKNEKY